MATSTIKETKVSETRDGETVTYTYLVDLGQDVRNPRTALALARATGPDPVPNLRAYFAESQLWVSDVDFVRTSERRDHWMATVNFTQLPPGEDEEQQNPNPLLRPPIYDVQYHDQEYVVKEARNVENIGSQFGLGGPFRAADTLGPIVNGASRRPDEPIVRTERIGVIVIEKNYADIGKIMDLNETYQKTTNSDSIAVSSKTFTARRLKYELTRSGGRQEEGGIVYVPGYTEISIHKSTDLKLDNVGFEYYENTQLKRAKDDEGNETAEPINLALDGQKLTTGTTQLTYRDLEPVAYAGFFQ